jgi:hypothetical protein
MYSRAPITDKSQATRIHGKINLFEGPGIKAGERIVFHAVADLDWLAAHFAIFDVALSPNRQVQDHRNLFPTIGAIEGVFH